MTTDQVTVYGGNDGTPEPYNVALVDRGQGTGKEQIVQVVGLDGNSLPVLIEGTDGFDLPVVNGATPFEVTATDPLPIAGAVSVSGTVALASEQAEDAPHVPGQAVVIAGVRNDEGAQLSDADLDITPFAVTALGYQIVNVANSVGVIVTPTSTIAVGLDLTGNGSTGPFQAGGKTLIEIHGDFVGTLTLEASIDNVNWRPVGDTFLVALATGAQADLSSDGMWLLTFDAWCSLRVTASDYDSGTAHVAMSGGTV